MLELVAMRAAMLLITPAAAMSARLERNMRRAAAHDPVLPASPTTEQHHLRRFHSK
jgi:hypothetical protein